MAMRLSDSTTHATTNAQPRRIPFAIQWAWPPPLLLILYSAPESPWWLVRHGDLAGARASLARLTSPTHHATLSDTVALMMHTDTLERDLSSGTRYLDCFGDTNLRRTEIVCVVFAAQVFSGLQLGGSPTYFFQQAGISTATAFKLAVGGLGLACLSTIVSWFLMARLGRRTIYVCGLAALSALMTTVGVVEVATENMAGKYAMGGLVLVWLFVYYCTVGPVCYAIISETGAAKLRAKTVCLSRISYYVAQIIGYTAQPYMVNPTEGNLKGKAAFVWAATGFTCFVWAFWRLPEMKGRTYEELDLLFAQGVPARRFASAEVDAYNDHVLKVREGVGECLSQRDPQPQSLEPHE